MLPSTSYNRRPRNKKLLKTNYFLKKLLEYSYFDTYRCTLVVGSPLIILESLGKPLTAGNLLACHLQFFCTALGPGEKGDGLGKGQNSYQGGLRHFQLLHDGPMCDHILTPASEFWLNTVKMKKKLAESS
jgi:hypothetical protein